MLVYLGFQAFKNDTQVFQVDHPLCICFLLGLEGIGTAELQMSTHKNVSESRCDHQTRHAPLKRRNRKRTTEVIKTNQASQVLRDQTHCV